MARFMIAALAASVAVAACQRTGDVVGPQSQTLAQANSMDPAPPQALAPNFNLEIILRAAGDTKGFGHVTFRQANDDATRVDLGVWVRDLAPNTHYWLQRTVDTAIDDHCTSDSWLTLGEGTVAQDIFGQYGWRPVNPTVAKKYAEKYPSRPGIFKIDDRIFGGWRTVDKKWFSQNGIMVKIERGVGGPTSG